ncbi:hypothetical protein [Mucilaginibacter flavidus]|uniref:hypothetical protein n=1 Tax=Mucilaginibacter flavidus TaxID=2949309 RepID=UPI002092DCE5|nr:hypothetical protein [Mucilaginibacter flavidus]MCO5946498.1 hypothetical protein [Mucilaginibacter flavidus]
MKAKVEDKVITHFASEKSLEKYWITPEEDIAWQNLGEGELNATMLLSAEKAFAEGWDVNNEEENAYWESL